VPSDDGNNSGEEDEGGSPNPPLPFCLPLLDSDDEEDGDHDDEGFQQVAPAVEEEAPGCC
jgi:hypothetical protein